MSISTHRTAVLSETGQMVLSAPTRGALRGYIECVLGDRWGWTGDPAQQRTRFRAEFDCKLHGGENYLYLRRVLTPPPATGKQRGVGTFLQEHTDGRLSHRYMFQVPMKRSMQLVPFDPTDCVASLMVGGETIRLRLPACVTLTSRKIFKGKRTVVVTPSSINDPDIQVPGAVVGEHEDHWIIDLPVQSRKVLIPKVDVIRLRLPAGELLYMSYSNLVKHGLVRS